jgi:hypothetical protein
MNIVIQYAGENCDIKTEKNVASRRKIPVNFGCRKLRDEKSDWIFHAEDFRTKIHCAFFVPETPGRKIHCAFSFPETPGRKIHYVFSFPETPGRKIH